MCWNSTPSINEIKTLTVANRSSHIPECYSYATHFYTWKYPQPQYSICSSKLKIYLLGTPFFQQYGKTLNLEQVSLTFNTPHESYVITFLFLLLTKKTITHSYLTHTQETLKIGKSNKLSVFQFHILFLFLSKHLKVKLFFLHLITLNFLHVLILLLTFSKFTKTLNPNLTIAPSSFKKSHIILSFSRQDILAKLMCPLLTLTKLHNNIIRYFSYSYDIPIILPRPHRTQTSCSSFFTPKN